MEDTIFSDEQTVERITNRCLEELKNRGVDKLPEEDFDEERANANLEALLKTKSLDHLVIKNPKS